MKRLIAPVAAVAILLAPIGGQVAVRAAQRGTTCSLTGKAEFTPGLGTDLTDTKYTFSGKLTDCRSTDGSLKSAKVTAAGAGTVGCATGTTKGTAKIKWNNGKKTTVTYNTYDAAALAELEGTVTSSTAKGFQKGDRVFGSLAFDADPTECSSAEGITTAVFQGQVGGGSPN